MSPITNLWDSYREHTDLINGAAIIEDGIVDKERWETAPRKVLILLKDPHDEDPNHKWNLVDTIRDGNWSRKASQKIWNTAGQMAFAIQNWDRRNFPGFPLESKESKDESRNALLQCAVVNIKKTGGGSAAKPEEILRWARETEDLLLSQIREINPEIILCGYTWRYIKRYWKNVNKIARAVYKPDDYFCIDYYHPANRYPNLLNYYALGGIMISSGLVDEVPKRM